ncbi:MAG TPA: nuclear transport factor 2 family protein [Gemmatimonadaceae bacterium]|nr:nuclear transport factor 2 family protein [Gemmatimonadaceae bacterium]
MTTIKTLRLSLGLLAVTAGASVAQAAPQPAEAEVMAVVKRIFDGMHEADSAKVRTAFAPGARFVNVGTRQNPDTITYDSIDGWLTGIARSNKQWEERISNVRIHVDANIASAWMDYVFVLGGAVRHCGVDSIELVKVKGEWKITQLVDTRRMTGCGG